MKQTEKGLVNCKSGGHGAHSQARERLRFAVHKLPISLTDVFTSGYVVSSNSNISELHREGRRIHGSGQRFRTAAHRLETASFIVHTPFRFFNHATRQSPARGSEVKVEGERHASNRVVTHILMIVV